MFFNGLTSVLDKNKSLNSSSRFVVIHTRNTVNITRKQLLKMLILVKSTGGKRTKQLHAILIYLRNEVDTIDTRDVITEQLNI